MLFQTKPPRVLFLQEISPSSPGLSRIFLSFYWAERAKYSTPCNNFTFSVFSPLTCHSFADPVPGPCLAGVINNYTQGCSDRFWPKVKGVAFHLITWHSGKAVWSLQSRGQCHTVSGEHIPSAADPLFHRHDLPRACCQCLLHSRAACVQGIIIKSAGGLGPQNYYIKWPMRGGITKNTTQKYRTSNVSQSFMLINQKCPWLFSFIIVLQIVFYVLPSSANHFSCVWGSRLPSRRGCFIKSSLDKHKIFQMFQTPLLA